MCELTVKGAVRIKGISGKIEPPTEQTTYYGCPVNHRQGLTGQNSEAM